MYFSIPFTGASPQPVITDLSMCKSVRDSESCSPKGSKNALSPGKGCALRVRVRSSGFSELTGGNGLDRCQGASNSALNPVLLEWVETSTVIVRPGQTTVKEVGRSM